MDYAQISTAILERTKGASQLAILRWFGLALAEKYATMAGARGRETSVYSPDDQRRGCTDGDYALMTRVQELRHKLSNVNMDYRATVECLERGLTQEQISIKAAHLAVADDLWREIRMTSAFMNDVGSFCNAFPVHPDVRQMLGLTGWVNPEQDVETSANLSSARMADKKPPTTTPDTKVPVAEALPPGLAKAKESGETRCVLDLDSAIIQDGLPAGQLNPNLQANKLAKSGGKGITPPWWMCPVPWRDNPERLSWKVRQAVDQQEDGPHHHNDHRHWCVIVGWSSVDGHHS